MPKAYMEGYLFITDSGRFSQKDDRPVVVGETYLAEGPSKRRNVGKYSLYAYKNVFTALRTAPSRTLCYVRISGDIQEDIEKFSGKNLQVLWVQDVSAALNEFICLCGERALHRQGIANHNVDEQSQNAIKVKRQWLEGKATDDELKQARKDADDVANTAFTDSDITRHFAEVAYYVALGDNNFNDAYLVADAAVNAAEEFGEEEIEKQWQRETLSRLTGISF